MMRVHVLEKWIGPRPILRGVSFEVPAGTVLGIIGTSGSGKTTLLRCLVGLERFQSGWIAWEDLRLEGGLSEPLWRRRRERWRRHVGMIFQHLYLFPHLNVLGNLIEAPVHVRRIPRREAEAQALELLDRMGLRWAAHRYPHSLSGGEQQRVAIARALMMRPDVLLLDEPTSALDPQRSADVRALLRQYVQQGHTMIVVSHAIGFLRGLADQLLYLEHGEVVECGPAEALLVAPQDPRTQAFLRHA
ncbi:MAG: amino acid ABC transporter ATP-binding protein [Bacteroidetes bacterium]|nr:amino acid ABC transporter ATP-binding protein [Rhodothermia bacterium]MCS7156047.1 amino acid ABC transporter ATP-binding protein [Bacteroidota bacterium]MCX7907735.1 amino acid ABC transporter ATP-binding protein [Bacteroidota bacterium]MDW8137864.1 amino acid ABC transporter ATP-binding protein [Bacteroidota bacterium]MDW8286285.1 amino acid ABC transporter ATP-binding protein [Bacteroidota bacterium]